MSGGSTRIAWICSGRRVKPVTRMEENCPWWGARTSNPCGAASLSQVGSTPTLFRQQRRDLLALNDSSPGDGRPVCLSGERGSFDAPECDPCHTCPCEKVLTFVWPVGGERNGYDERQNPCNSPVCSSSLVWRLRKLAARHWPVSTNRATRSARMRRGWGAAPMAQTAPAA